MTGSGRESAARHGRAEVDRDLVERAVRGDTDAFGTIVQTLTDHLYAVAYRIVRDTGRAEDATQQAFLDMWRHLPQLRDPARFEAWAYRCLTRACYAELRRGRRWDANLRALPDPSGVEPDHASAIVRRDALRHAFRRIPPEQRAAIVLHHYAGLSVPEVAEALRIPSGTVRSRLFYGMRTLRDAFSSADETGAKRGLA
jgi:RNA polymerase sigma-70 factor, ECF subfamily